MQKFILFFILSILFLAFGTFLLNAYLLQKNFFKDFNRDKQQNDNNTVQELVQLPSVYINYNKEEYDKALLDKRAMVLYFTSNWCQECLAQEIVNQEVFKELSEEGIVGLRIHILDSETTIETDALAKKFEVSKEQSFVFLDKNGAVYFKYTGVFKKDQLKDKILELR